jgi:hypothetical protein
MKNNRKEYKGLSKEEKRYLREFDKAVELGIFDNKLINFSDEMKKEIQGERDVFRADLMVRGKRSGEDIESKTIDNKPHVGRKRVKRVRDKNGKFVKKEQK